MPVLTHAGAHACAHRVSEETADCHHNFHPHQNFHRALYKVANGKLSKSPLSFHPMSLL